MEDIKCRNCGHVHLQGSCPHRQGPAPKLPQADPWDRRIGTQHLLDFSVDCLWIPVNEDWAQLISTIHLRDGEYKLSKEAEVFRVRSERNGTPVESPELTAIAWTKKMIGSGGVTVTGLYERNPGHLLTPRVPDGALKFRWWASVGSRLSVAVVRLDGNLAGQARLVPVE